MKISAKVVSGPREHEARVCTGAATQTLAVPRKPDGPGSAVNGGEFLMLALATCYCNDLFREAQRLGIAIDAVEVEASGEFAARGLAATNITYRATVRSPAPAAEVQRLLRETDAVAEVHNTVRSGVPVRLVEED
jgi:organic hydroperoxide reductase OsmC/OhrA